MNLFAFKDPANNCSIAADAEQYFENIICDSKLTRLKKQTTLSTGAVWSLTSHEDPCVQCFCGCLVQG